MATLNTMRAILKDERLRKQTGKLRSQLELLYKDLGRLESRVTNLDKHFSLAARDVDELKVSAKKAFKKPNKEKSIEVRTTAKTVKAIFSIIISVKNKEIAVTTTPTNSPLATPPATHPVRIIWFGIGVTKSSSMLFVNFALKNDETTFP